MQERPAEMTSWLHDMSERYHENNFVDSKKYAKYEVKRGLRNPDGTGVLAGVTRIGSVQGYYMEDGERVPVAGRLYYRGINVADLIEGFLSDNRFGFEETAYLLLFGDLPSASDLAAFKDILHIYQTLPGRFTEEMILPAPSRDVMNKLSRSVLALYSYDDDAENNSYEAQLDKAIQLIARAPVIVAHAFAAKQHYFDNQSLYLHRPQDNLSVAENFLYSVRRDNLFTDDEAKLLDLCMVLHAEHGGGNNSAFAVHVLSSTGTDIYSSIAGAVGSLKGPRHGGANKKVIEQFDYIKEAVTDWKDDDAIRAFLEKLSTGEAGDHSGLIYGMGHAIYSISDPRAAILKRFARTVAATKGMSEELDLVEAVERLAPPILNRKLGDDKVYCANVDLYSGLVYKMLDIPQELYTPLFAISRMVGWCAHRIEEVCNSNKIIRPAYKSVMKPRKFVPMSQR